MKHKSKFLLFAIFTLLYGSASAFCGFYVAQAGASVFNNKSEVIIVRDGTKQTITMLNDFKGDLKKFAMVIPVPVVLKRNDIRVMEQSLFGTFDNYSAPRMVEYFDQNPCQKWDYESDMYENLKASSRSSMEDKASSVYKREKVTIEAQYTVEEYEIVILSATESGGLEEWLKSNGYAIPENANEVLQPYIKDKMKFFAVKINLEKARQMNRQYLRPIQITFNTPKFMLPIRLGMANSNGEQDLIIYCFTKTGRVEAANYRTIEIPSAKKIPTFVQQNFVQFYKDVFDKNYEKEGKNAVFVEYAWNVSPNWGVKCDPCTGNPPIVQDLINAGVGWIDAQQSYTGNVFFTRLHVRYSREKFPEDLTFIETPNNATYQVRQIITHPATGDFQCKEGITYLQDLRTRRRLELQEMQAMAGWDSDEYPFYVELGDGTKVPVEKEDGQNRNSFPVWFHGNGAPPSWLLPVFLLIAASTIYLIRKWKWRNPISTELR
ncbi:MAG: DUF2330 domain-containing protein [Bacteroidetes bacterium]|nr:DUF2330 domain-containing protein [Bacteroidota bacterium]